MEITKKEFGRFVADRRRGAGLTQRELADRLHVTESAVSKWERGLSFPDITMVNLLAKELGVGTQELISASEDLDGHLNTRDAKRYRRWRGAFLWTMLTVYATTIVTCVIVNLSVNHTLSWFWVVLAAVALAFSLTTLPLLPVPAPGWMALFGSVFSLGALLLIVWLSYTPGIWIVITSAALMFALIVVFGPILLSRMQPTAPLNRHRLLMILFIDTVALGVLLLVIFVALGRPDLLLDPVFAITAIALVPVWIIALLLRYLPVNGLGRAAVAVALGGVSIFGVQIGVRRILGESDDAYLADLTQWNELTIDANVQLLILVGSIALAVVLGIAALIRARHSTPDQ